MTETRNRGRLQLVLLAVAFLGPLALAFWLYYGLNWSPEARAVHGELISPPLELPDKPLVKGSGARLRDLWSLLIVAPGDCDDACRKVLYETRQLRLALGADRDRLQRVWIIESGVPDLRFVEAEHPDLLIVQANTSVGVELLNHIDARSDVDIYLVDPHGNLMMRFPAELVMRDMHTDIKRLMKISRIG